MDILTLSFFLILSSSVDEPGIFTSSNSGYEGAMLRGQTTVINQTEIMPTPLVLGAEYSDFGHAISMNPFFTVVGAPNMNGKGSAYVLNLGDSISWQSAVILEADDAETGDLFGKSVGLTSDFILVGAPGDDDLGQDSGSAYIFEYEFNGSYGHDWVPNAKLVAADGMSDDMFGHAISIDGNRALVGAYQHDSIDVDAGAAYVFDFDGSSWQQSAKLLADDGQSLDQFGWSVSLDGDRAIVGAIGHNNGTSKGAIYVFEFDGSNWQQTAKISNQENTSNKLSWSLALFENHIIAGSVNHSNAESGSATIYNYDQGQWITEQAILPSGQTEDSLFGWSVDIVDNMVLVGSTQGLGSAESFRFENGSWVAFNTLTPQNIQAGDQFGYAVGLSGGFGSVAMVGNVSSSQVAGNSGSVHVFNNFGGFFEEQQLDAYAWTRADTYGESVSILGNRALVGAPFDDDVGFNSGSAYIYDFIGGQWQLAAKILAEDGSVGDQFGVSVSLSGNRALIGARSDNESINDSGAAYVFELVGNEWVQTSKLKASDPGFRAFFGNSVSLSGTRVLIGANGNNAQGGNVGAAYVFELLNNDWVEIDKLSATTNVYDYFGSSVSLDGDRAVVGARWDETNGSESGAAYVFTHENGVWSETAHLYATDAQIGDEFGNAVSLDGDRLLVGAHREGEFNQSAGAAYVFEFDGNTWAEVSKITPSAGEDRDYFGCSVSLFDDHVSVGACERNAAGENSGAAYVYEFNAGNWDLVSELTADGTGRNDRFGASVAGFENLLMVGAPNHDGHNENSGAAYIYRIEADLIFDDGFDEVISN